MFARGAHAYVNRIVHAATPHVLIGPWSMSCSNSLTLLMFHVDPNARKRKGESEQARKRESEKAPKRASVRKLCRRGHRLPGLSCQEPCQHRDDIPCPNQATIRKLGGALLKKLVNISWRPAIVLKHV